MPHSTNVSTTAGLVSSALHALVSKIPASLELPSADPGKRVKSIAQIAALKAAAISGTFTLPPGPLGLATVVPDLLSVWRIQQQLVADIAAAFGKTAALTPETMVICLFQHGGAALTQRLFTRTDDHVLVHRIANRTLQQLLEKIGVRLAQRIAAKSVSRWVPLLGAVGAGAYAYYDTTHVAATSIGLFSGNVRLQEEAAGEEVRPATRRKPSSTVKRPRAAAPRAAKKSRR